MSQLDHTWSKDLQYRRMQRVSSTTPQYHQHAQGGVVGGGSFVDTTFPSHHTKLNTLEGFYTKSNASATATSTAAQHDASSMPPQAEGASNATMWSTDLNDHRHHHFDFRKTNSDATASRVTFAETGGGQEEGTHLTTGGEHFKPFSLNSTKRLRLASPLKSQEDKYGASIRIRPPPSLLKMAAAREETEEGRNVQQSFCKTNDTQTSSVRFEIDEDTAAMPSHMNAHHSPIIIRSSSAHHDSVGGGPIQHQRRVQRRKRIGRSRLPPLQQLIGEQHHRALGRRPHHHQHGDGIITSSGGGGGGGGKSSNSSMSLFADDLTEAAFAEYLPYRIAYHQHPHIQSQIVMTAKRVVGEGRRRRSETQWGLNDEEADDEFYTSGGDENPSFSDASSSSASSDENDAVNESNGGSSAQQGLFLFAGHEGRDDVAHGDIVKRIGKTRNNLPSTSPPNRSLLIKPPPPASNIFKRIRKPMKDSLQKLADTSRTCPQDGHDASAGNAKVFLTRSLTNGIAAKPNVQIVYLVQSREEEGGEDAKRRGEKELLAGCVVDDDGENDTALLTTAIHDVFDAWIANNALVIARELGHAPDPNGPSNEKGEDDKNDADNKGGAVGDGRDKSKGEVGGGLGGILAKAAASRSVSPAGSGRSSSAYGGNSAASSRMLSSKGGFSGSTVGGGGSSSVGGRTDDLLSSAGFMSKRSSAVPKRGAGDHHHNDDDVDGDEEHNGGVLALPEMTHLTTLLLERARCFSTSMVHITKPSSSSSSSSSFNSFYNDASQQQRNRTIPRGLNIRVKLRMRHVAPQFHSALLGEGRCPQFELSAGLDPFMFDGARDVEGLLSHWQHLAGKLTPPLPPSALSSSHAPPSSSAASSFLKLFIGSTVTASFGDRATKGISSPPPPPPSPSAALSDYLARAFLFSDVEPINYSYAATSVGSRTVAAGRERAFKKECAHFKARQAQRLARMELLGTVMVVLPMLKTFIEEVRQRLTSFGPWVAYQNVIWQLMSQRMAAAEEREALTQAQAEKKELREKKNDNPNLETAADGVSPTFLSPPLPRTTSIEFLPPPLPPPPPLPKHLADEVRAVSLAVAPCLDSQWGRAEWEAALTQWVAEEATMGGVGGDNNDVCRSEWRKALAAEWENAAMTRGTFLPLRTFLRECVNRTLHALASLSADGINDWLATSLVMELVDEEERADDLGSEFDDDDDNGDEDDSKSSNDGSSTASHYSRKFQPLNPHNGGGAGGDDGDHFTVTGCHFTFSLIERNCQSIVGKLINSGHNQRQHRDDTDDFRHPYFLAGSYPLFNRLYALCLNDMSVNSGSLSLGGGEGRTSFNLRPDTRSDFFGRREEGAGKTCFSIPFASIGSFEMCCPSAAILPPRPAPSTDNPSINIDAFKINLRILQSLGDAVGLAALLDARAKRLASIKHPSYGFKNDVGGGNASTLAAQQRQRKRIAFEEALLNHEMAKAHGFGSVTEWTIIVDGRDHSKKKSNRRGKRREAMGKGQPPSSARVGNASNIQNAATEKKPTARDLLFAIHEMRRRLQVDKYGFAVEHAREMAMGKASGGETPQDLLLPSLSPSARPSQSSSSLPLLLPPTIPPHRIQRAHGLINPASPKPIESLTILTALQLANLCALVVMQPAPGSDVGLGAGLSAGPFECLGLFEEDMYRWRQGSNELLFPQRAVLPNTLANAVTSTALYANSHPHPPARGSGWAATAPSIFYRLRFLQSLQPMNALTMAFSWLGLTVVKAAYGQPADHLFTQHLVCGDFGGKEELLSRAGGAFANPFGSSAPNLDAAMFEDHDDDGPTASDSTDGSEYGHSGFGAPKKGGKLSRNNANNPPYASSTASAPHRFAQPSPILDALRQGTARPPLADVVIETDSGLVHLMTPLACVRLYQGRDPMLAHTLLPALQACLRSHVAARTVAQRRRDKILDAVQTVHRFMRSALSTKQVKHRHFLLHQRFAALLVAKEKAHRGLSIALQEHHYTGATHTLGPSHFSPAAMAQRRQLLNVSITAQQSHKESYSAAHGRPLLSGGGLGAGEGVGGGEEEGNEDLIRAFGGHFAAADSTRSGQNNLMGGRLNGLRKGTAGRRGVALSAVGDDIRSSGGAALAAEISLSSDEDSTGESGGEGGNQDPIMKALFGSSNHSAAKAKKGSNNKTKKKGHANATNRHRTEKGEKDHDDADDHDGKTEAAASRLQSGVLSPPPPQDDRFDDTASLAASSATRPENSYASTLFVATRGLRQNKFMANNNGALLSNGGGGDAADGSLIATGSLLSADGSVSHHYTRQPAAPVFFSELPPALRASIRHLLTLESNYRSLIIEECTISFEVSIRQEYIRLFPLVGVQVDEMHGRKRLHHQRWADYLAMYTTCYGGADCAIRKSILEQERRARQGFHQRARVFTTSITSVTEERKYRDSLETLEEECFAALSTPSCAFPPLLALLVFAAETRHALTAPPPLISNLATGLAGLNNSNATSPVAGRGRRSTYTGAAPTLGGGGAGARSVRGGGAPSLSPTTATSMIRKQAQIEIVQRTSDFVKQSSIRLFQECYQRKNETAVRERSERAFLLVTVGTKIVLSEEQHKRRAMEVEAGQLIKEHYLFGYAPTSLLYHERTGRERLFFTSTLEMQALHCRIIVGAEEMQQRDLITCVGYCERRQVSLGEWHPPLSIVDLAAVNRGLNQALNDGVQLSRLQQIAQTGIRHVLSGLQKERDSVMGMISTIEHAEMELRRREEEAVRAQQQIAQQEANRIRQEQLRQQQINAMLAYASLNSKGKRRSLSAERDAASAKKAAEAMEAHNRNASIMFGDVPINTSRGRRGGGPATATNNNNAKMTALAQQQPAATSTAATARGSGAPVVSTPLSPSQPAPPASVFAAQQATQTAASSAAATAVVNPQPQGSTAPPTAAAVNTAAQATTSAQEHNAIATTAASDTAGKNAREDEAIGKAMAQYVPRLFGPMSAADEAGATAASLADEPYIVRSASFTSRYHHHNQPEGGEATMMAMQLPVRQAPLMERRHVNNRSLFLSQGFFGNGHVGGGGFGGSEFASFRRNLTPPRAFGPASSGRSSRGPLPPPHNPNASDDRSHSSDTHFVSNYSFGNNPSLIDNGHHNNNNGSFGGDGAVVDSSSMTALQSLAAALSSSGPHEAAAATEGGQQQQKPNRARNRTISFIMPEKEKGDDAEEKWDVGEGPAPKNEEHDDNDWMSMATTMRRRDIL